MAVSDTELADMAARMAPFLAPLLQITALGEVDEDAVGGGGSGFASSPHDMYGAHHTGEADISQYPQALLLDGSRSLTGNLAVGSGVTIDGVDLSAFKTLYDALADNDVIAGAGLTGGGQIDSGDLTLNVGAGNGISVAADSVAVDQAYAFSWTGAHAHTQTMTTRTLLPGSDVSDIGSSSAWYRSGYIAELNSLIFAENAIVLLGDRFMVCKGQGKLPAAVGSGATSIDFGQSMTLNDMVLFRAAGQFEWVKVGSLVSGTTYNVTRNVDGSGANAWPVDNPFAILGQSPNGYIQMTAESTPKFQILKMGTTWNDQTEVVRLGDLNGAYGVSSELYGIGIGDYVNGNYLKYDTAAGFEIKAGGDTLTLGDDGIYIDAPALSSGGQGYKMVRPSDNAILASWSAAYSAGSNHPELVGYDVTGADTTMFIEARGAAGRLSRIYMQALEIGAGTGQAVFDMRSRTQALDGTLIDGLLVTQVSQYQFETTAVSSGQISSYVFTPAARTGQTASTENPTLDFAFGRTTQWATGALTTQRDTIFRAPTYSAVAASVFTHAATVAIEGPPAAGTNLTITNPYSLWTQNGAVSHDMADSGTTTAPVALYLRHNSSGTPAANFGVAVQFQAETTTTENQNIAALRARWTVSTHASRRGELQVLMSDSGGTYTAIEFGANGAALIGFLGATAVARQVITGSRGSALATVVQNLLNGLQALGLITNSTTA